MLRVSTNIITSKHDTDCGPPGREDSRSSYINHTGVNCMNVAGKADDQHMRMHPPSTYNRTSLGLSKQNLLAKPDWLNLSAARPVQLDFASAADMSKVGRHKKRSLVGQGRPKKTRLDYESQFNQPTLGKRKRGIETTSTMMPPTKALCDTTPPLSNTSKYFPSSPPFSVAQFATQGTSDAPQVLPRPETSLRDPNRDSYMLESSCDDSQPQTKLISLDRVRDFRSFEEVQNAYRANSTAIPFEKSPHASPTNSSDNHSVFRLVSTSISHDLATFNEGTKKSLVSDKTTTSRIDVVAPKQPRQFSLDAEFVSPDINLQGYPTSHLAEFAERQFSSPGALPCQVAKKFSLPELHSDEAEFLFEQGFASNSTRDSISQHSLHVSKIFSTP